MKRLSLTEERWPAQAVNRDSAMPLFLLHQPEAGPLVLNRVVRNVFPEKCLNAFAVGLAELHEADGEMTTRYPHDMGRCKLQRTFPVRQRNGQ